MRVGTAAGVCVWRGEEVNATGMGGASSPTQSPKAFGLPGLPRALSMRAGESEALDVASIVADAADGSAVDGAGDEARRSLRLTPELATALAEYSGGGSVGLDQMMAVAEQFRALQNQAADGSIRLDAFPPQVQKMLRAFDQNDDGCVAPNELARAAELYKEQRRRSKQLRWLVWILVLLLGLMLASMTGITFAVVELTKEMQTSKDGVTTVKGEADVLVKTGTVAMPRALSSRLPDGAFQSLSTFVVESPTGAHLELAVLGWFRVKPTDSIHDEYVSIITLSGNIKLKGESMQFEPLVGRAFEDAGFEVRASGRKLNGVYEIIGLFNSIEEWEGLEAGEGPPIFGSSDFVMEYYVLYQCGQGGALCHSDLFEEDMRSVVTIDGEKFAKISKTAYHDVHLGAVLEYATNPEYQYSQKVTYQSANMSVAYQLSGLAAGEEAPYYCTEEGEAWPTLDDPQPSPGSWNVSNASKLGEEFDEASGVVIREFSIDIEITEDEYLLLTDGAEPPANFSGFMEMRYYDEKESLHPVMMKMGPNITIVITSYYEESVDLTEWRTPDGCVSDDPYATHTPTLMGEDPYQFDHKRRRQIGGHISVEDFADHYNGTYTAVPFYVPDWFDESFVGVDDYTYDYTDEEGEAEEAEEAEVEEAHRSLLDAAFADAPAALRARVASSPAHAARARSLAGNRRGKSKHAAVAGARSLAGKKKKKKKKGNGVSSNWCPDDFPKDYCYPTMMFEEKVMEFQLFEFEMVTWRDGCGVKEATVKTEAGKCPGGGSLYGTCEGSTPLLCRGSWSLRCALGCEWSFEDFLPGSITKHLKGLNLDAELFIELGYTFETVLDLKGGGRIGKIKTFGLGPWKAKKGFQASFEVQGTIDVGKKRLGVKFSIGAKACWGACIGFSLTVLNLSQNF